MKTKKDMGAKHEVDYVPARPTYIRPVTKGSKTINGQKYYIGVKGQLYKASMFDAFFKPVKTGSAQRYSKSKGANPNKQAIA